MQQTISKNFHIITNTLTNTKIKHLINIKLLSKLPFYEILKAVKTNHVFRAYAMSYKVKLVEKKDPIKHLEASKSCIKDLFNDLLLETKGFKYQITLKIMVKNTSQMEKLNLLLFISIRQQKQRQSTDLVSKMLFKRFCKGFIIGLIKDLAELLN